MKGRFTSSSPDETFTLGESLGAELRPGDAVLFTGGLGAGKTLFIKGIVQSLDFPVEEVTSPSFALVNLYETPKADVFHIDLWRIDQGSDVAFGVGLEEIVDNPRAIVLIEWADRLGPFRFPAGVIRVAITGDGDDPRTIDITRE